jgi:hypothetical protein
MGDHKSKLDYEILYYAELEVKAAMAADKILLTQFRRTFVFLMPS